MVTWWTKDRYRKVGGGLFAFVDGDREGVLSLFTATFVDLLDIAEPFGGLFDGAPCGFGDDGFELSSAFFLAGFESVCGLFLKFAFAFR